MRKLRARPHCGPCFCPDCIVWDDMARHAPPTRCAETHAYETDEPCQHGVTLFCPSFGIAPSPDQGAYP